MIAIDEETVDKAIDDILGTDESVRGKKTETAGDGQAEGRWNMPGEGTEQATCRKCGTTFLRPPKSKRTICPACFSASVSASMKASHAKRRERREAAAAASPREPDARSAEANGRQIRSGSAEQPKEAAEAEKDPVERAWDALDEAAEATGRAVKAVSEAERNAAAPEREPKDWSEDELRGKLADGLKKDAGDVVLALYECIRDVARTAGIQTRIVLESMYELDTVLSHIGGV